MADYDFPPLLQGEGPTLDAASILQAQNAGEWSRKFGEHGAGKNNLMTRKRHNANIARETEVNQQLQEEHQLNTLKTNKGALDLYLRGKKLDMDLKVGQANLDEKARKAEAAEKMLPLDLEAKRATTNAALARETATTEGTRLKARIDERQSQHTTGFQTEVGAALDSGVEIGSREYVEAVTRARIKYPGAEKAYADDIWKTTGSDMSFEDAVKQHQEALATAGKNTTVTTKLPGGGTMTDRPANAAADRTFAATQLSRAQARKDRATKAADDVTAKEADEDIAQWSSRLEQADAATKGGAPTQPLVERTAVNPTTGQRVVFRNGAWVPLTQ